MLKTTKRIIVSLLAIMLVIGTIPDFHNAFAKDYSEEKAIFELQA